MALHDVTSACMMHFVGAGGFWFDNGCYAVLCCADFTWETVKALEIA
jgi:hypothetical protein